MAENLLLLIDGNSLVHRAYHALPPLSTSSGQPTNALYGFVQMILPLLEEKQPRWAAVAFDAPGPTFRHELSEAYKATRPEADPELRSQMDLARELVDALGLLRLEISGVEADDIIGTLAEWGRQAGHEVLIVSGDRDLVQLVKPGVAVMAPLKGMSDVKIYDEAAVREQYGIGPELIADLKALAGDPSDNIPGIAGIGPAGAAKLLQQFGGLIELYNRLEEIPQETLRQRLELGREAAMSGRQLARIKTDVPLEISEEQLRWHGPNVMAARRLFARLEFQNVLARTSHWGASWEGDIRVADEASLATLCEQARAVGHLTIAPASGPHGERAFALAAGESQAWIWPLAVPPPESAAGTLIEEESASIPECLRHVLEEEAVAKWGVRLKEAARMLWGANVRLAGYDFDAEIADYVLAPQRTDHSVMLLAAAELGWWAPDENGKGNAIAASGKDARTSARKSGRRRPAEPTFGEEADRLPRWQLRAAVEALAVERLRDKLCERLAEQQGLRVFREIEMPLVGVLAEMERVGIAVDAKQLQALDEQWREELRRMTEEIHQLAGVEFNLDSPKQVGEVLFGRLGLKGGKKTKTGWSTSAEVLEELAGESEIVRRILAYRELAKLYSTYVTGLLREIDPRTGRIHTTFEQTVTATGRLSSRSPNLQNIPVRTEAGRQIRSCFVAGPGQLLIKADYSQIELRLLAHFCGDENLRQAFMAGEDIHRRTAAIIFGVPPEQITPEMRRTAKTVNFAVLYGMGSLALSKELGISRAEAQAFIDNYFRVFSSVKAYLENVIQQARERGYTETLFGRRRYLPELHSPDRQVEAYAERAAMNTPLQGSAADIVKVAMIRLAKRLAEEFPAARLLLQVHDELLVEAPAEQAPQVAELMQEVMSGVVQLEVPLSVAVAWGPNWRDVE